MAARRKAGTSGARAKSGAGGSGSRKPAARSSRTSRRPAGKTGASGARRRTVPPGPEMVELESLEALEKFGTHSETGPGLTGGDVDADWQRAYASGDEAVGGSVATPDQDVVDEIGRALGVEQESDGEVRPSEEILHGRDRHYWHLERRAADAEGEDA